MSGTPAVVVTSTVPAGPREGRMRGLRVCRGGIGGACEEGGEEDEMLSVVGPGGVVDVA